MQLSCAVAGTLPLTFGLVTMGVYHAVIGIIEGVCYCSCALALIIHARPDIVDTGLKSLRGHKHHDG